jgi:hypothetical protein
VARSKPDPDFVILFVGGNETQKRITAGLGRELPSNLNVAFIHPGFPKNWDKPLADAMRLLPRTDAIVITTDMPTLLGESLRSAAREANIPVVSGTYRGKTRIIRAIDEAHESALARALSNSPGGSAGGNTAPSSRRPRA